MTALSLSPNSPTGDGSMPSSNIPDGHHEQPNCASVLSEDKSMPIAVIGIGFRGPADATDVQGLWKMILERREAFSAIPKKRWNHDAFYHPDHARHGTVCFCLFQSI